MTTRNDEELPVDNSMLAARVAYREAVLDETHRPCHNDPETCTCAQCTRDRPTNAAEDDVVPCRRCRPDLNRRTMNEASRVSPLLRSAVATVERWVRDHNWSDYDMHQAWEAGAQWACDRAEIEDGELFVPTDEAGVEGRDWADECGHWLNDYQEEW